MFPSSSSRRNFSRALFGVASVDSSGSAELRYASARSSENAARTSEKVSSRSAGTSVWLLPPRGWGAARPGDADLKDLLRAPDPSEPPPPGNVLAVVEFLLGASPRRHQLHGPLEIGRCSV